MDYHDNNGPLFEDLFIQLAEYGVKVRWTRVPDQYYQGLTEKAEEKYKTKKPTGNTV